MKPKKGEGNAEMEEPLKDPLQLVKELVLLIVEARTPDLSVKGRVEGPHCPVIRGRPAHKCSAEKVECIRASDFCFLAQRLWSNGIPVCLDTVLFPDCPHGKEESLVTEGTVTKVARENALLVERWTINASKRRQEDGLSYNMLLQAVRSYLHFSQISSWLYSAGGKLPGVLAYRVYAPGEERILDFPRPSDSHQFPTCQASGQHVRVGVLSLLRQPSVPVLLCSQQQSRDESPNQDTSKSRNEIQARSDFLGSDGSRPPKSYKDSHFAAVRSKGGKFRTEAGSLGDNLGQKRTRAKTKNVKSLQEQVTAKIHYTKDTCDFLSGDHQTGQDQLPFTSRALHTRSHHDTKDSRHTLSQKDISMKKAQNIAHMKMSDGGDTVQICGDVLLLMKSDLQQDTDSMEDIFEAPVYATLAQPKRTISRQKGLRLPLPLTREILSLHNKTVIEDKGDLSVTDGQIRLGRGVKKKDEEKDMRIEQMKGNSLKILEDQEEASDALSYMTKGAHNTQTGAMKKREAEYSIMQKALLAHRSNVESETRLWQTSGKSVKTLQKADRSHRKDAAMSSRVKIPYDISAEHGPESFTKELNSDARYLARKKSISQKEACEEEFIHRLSERLSLASSQSCDHSSPQEVSAKPKQSQATTENSKGLKISSGSKNVSPTKKPVYSAKSSYSSSISVVEDVTDKQSLQSNGKLSTLTIDVSRSTDVFEDSDDTPVASPNQTPRPKFSGAESLVKSLAERSIKQTLQSYHSDSAQSLLEEIPLQLAQSGDTSMDEAEQDGTRFISKSRVDSTSQFQSKPIVHDSDSVVDWKLRYSTFASSQSEKSFGPESHPTKWTAVNRSEDSSLADRQVKPQPNSCFPSKVGTELTLKDESCMQEERRNNDRQKTDESSDHPNCSRKMFEQNLLPLVSYDADSDSFKKVEQSYSSNILHSPKVLFSCDVPSARLAESRKCIDFGEDLESQFFKTKISDMIDPETIGRYMADLAALSASSSTNGFNSCEGVICESSFHKSKKTVEYSRDCLDISSDHQRTASYNLKSSDMSDGSSAEQDSEGGFVFDGEFSDGEPFISKFRDVGDMKVTKDGHVIHLTTDSSFVTGRQSGEQDRENYSRRTKRQLKYGPIEESSLKEVLYNPTSSTALQPHLRPDDADGFMKKQITEEYHHHASLHLDGLAPHISPSLSSSLSSSSSSASSVCLRSTSLSPASSTFKPSRIKEETDKGLNVVEQRNSIQESPEQFAQAWLNNGKQNFGKDVAESSRIDSVGQNIIKYTEDFSGRLICPLNGQPTDTSSVKAVIGQGTSRKPRDINESSDYTQPISGTSPELLSETDPFLSDSTSVTAKPLQHLTECRSYEEFQETAHQVVPSVGSEITPSPAKAIESLISPGTALVTEAHCLPPPPSIQAPVSCPQLHPLSSSSATSKDTCHTSNNPTSLSKVILPLPLPQVDLDLQERSCTNHDFRQKPSDKFESTMNSRSALKQQLLCVPDPLITGVNNTDIFTNSTSHDHSEIKIHAISDQFGCDCSKDMSSVREVNLIVFPKQSTPLQSSASGVSAVESPGSSFTGHLQLIPWVSSLISKISLPFSSRPESATATSSLDNILLEPSSEIKTEPVGSALACDLPWHPTNSAVVRLDSSQHRPSQPTAAHPPPHLFHSSLSSKCDKLSPPSENQVQPPAASATVNTGDCSGNSSEGQLIWTLENHSGKESKNDAITDDGHCGKIFSCDLICSKVISKTVISNFNNREKNHNLIIDGPQWERKTQESTINDLNPKESLKQNTQFMQPNKSLALVNHLQNKANLARLDEMEKVQNIPTLSTEVAIIEAEMSQIIEAAAKEKCQMVDNAASTMHHEYSFTKIIQTRLGSRSDFVVKEEDDNTGDNNQDGGNNDDGDNGDVVFYISEPKDEPRAAKPKSALTSSLLAQKPSPSPALRPSSLYTEMDLEMRSKLHQGMKTKDDLGSRSQPFNVDTSGWCSTPPHRTVSTPSCIDREVRGQSQKSPSKASVIQQLNCDTASQIGLRKLTARSVSMIFNSRTGLPTQSSPAPLKRKPGGKFDYDATLLSTRAIKNAFSCSKLASNDLNKSEENEEEKKRTLSTSAPASTNCLLGNFEESILNGRIDPVGTVDGFTAEIGASGSFCPKHLHLPVSAFFFSLSDDNAPSPYLGHINLDCVSKKGYHIPKKGTVQVTLFNPNKTVVKMFVVMYDLSDMPPSSQTFIRQRTIYCPTDKNSTAPSYLRYLIHLRCASSRSGKIYLHTDIRLIFARHKLDIDAKTVPYELKSFTEGPKNPKYSPKK